MTGHSLISGVLVACLLLALAGCGSGDDQSQTDTALSFYEILNSTNQADLDTHVADSGYVEHQVSAAFTYDGLKQLGAGRASSEFIVHRTISQGEYVFLHVEERLMDGRSLARGELYRFDADGKIAEHWGNVQDAPPMNMSGRSMFDGPGVDTAVDYGCKYSEMAAGQERLIFDEYRVDIAYALRQEPYHQHSAGGQDGIDSLAQGIQFLQMNGISIRAVNHLRVCEGDFSVSLNNYIVEPAVDGLPPDTFVFDLQRANAEGLGVEHWDIVESIEGVDKSRTF